jgi:hypothetical protein
MWRVIQTVAGIEHWKKGVSGAESFIVVPLGTFTHFTEPMSTTLADISEFTSSLSAFAAL